MLDISSFPLFVLSVFLLSITPGPDMAYVVGQSIANGRRAGVISAAGVALGSCTHALFSIAGLTALIAVLPGGEHYTASLLVLGLAYTLVAFLTDAAFAVLAGSAAGALSRNATVQGWLDRVVGTLFIGLGIRLALVRS